VPSRSDAVSTHTGVLLMLAITIALSALVLLLLTQYPGMWQDEEVPVIFEITGIRDADDNGKIDYNSYVTLTNTGDHGYDNRKLAIRTYRNGELLPYMVPYINFNKFIKVHPHGIETIGGAGTDNYHWYPGAIVFIDYKDGTFRPGNVVTLEVYDRITNQVISRDTWPHTKDTRTKKLMDLLFNHRGA